MVLRFHDKGPKPAQRAPDRNRRQNENARGRLALGKTECRPDHDRSADEGDRVITRRNREPAAEDDFAQADEQEQKNTDLDHITAAPFSRRTDRPEEDKRCHDEVARGVAQPPCRPNGPVFCPIGVAAECQTGDPKSWAHQRAHNCSERKCENILRPIERARAAREPVDHPRAADCLERIAGGDAE